MLPPDYIEEPSQLLDAAPPIAGDEIHEMLERKLDTLVEALSALLDTAANKNAGAYLGRLPLEISFRLFGWRRLTGHWPVREPAQVARC